MTNIIPFPGCAPFVPKITAAEPGDYHELHMRSAFSFLRGSSLPDKLAGRAAELELSKIALCDRDGVQGMPRFYGEAKRGGIKTMVGSELTMEDGSVLPVLVKSRKGYQNLCRLITGSKLRAIKGESVICWNELSEFSEDLMVLTGDEEGPVRRALARDEFDQAASVIRRLADIFGSGNVGIEIQRHWQRGERRWNAGLETLAQKTHLPLVATNGVLYHKPEGRALYDVFTCARHHTHLDAAGQRLQINHERHLKSGKEMIKLFADLPTAISNTKLFADQLKFSLENLDYQFPEFEVPSGHDMDSYLRELTNQGAEIRYNGKITPGIRDKIGSELALIKKLKFACYFLIVQDIVRFCNENRILVQGRGSAANSVVCYCLRITAIDPIKYDLLFARFLSDRESGWPDIDLDLPSGDQRERVIQEVYRRYGQRGAAMTANVITFRGRSAMREVGKALNLPVDVLDRFSKLYASGDYPHTMPLDEQLKASGLTNEHPRARAFVDLYKATLELPRHLGQHSGGMIICQGRLDSVVPLEPASMPGRVVAQWDKDDCEDLGIVKIDLLGLGMLAAMEETFELCGRKGGPKEMAALPQDDAETFQMIRAAETIGVFQIESRAQMATLPRMSPETFYHIAVQVAIIRPGPIQGDLTNPYLERRTQGVTPDTADCLDERLRPILARTLGVPLFQEQLLSIAMKMAGFEGSEANELRRALSFNRSEKRMIEVKAKLRAAMERRNVKPQVVERIVQATGSFALYGFPESHAISFAMLAYGSSYLKVHYPTEFYVGLLNNQPMGFYSSDTLLKDAQRRGVKVLPLCAAKSEYKCTVEADRVIRLGLCTVKGVHKTHAEALALRRPFGSLEALRRSVPELTRDELRILAKAGAFNCYAAHRREALWSVERAMPAEGELFDWGRTSVSPLPAMTRLERVNADYETTSMTGGRHPMAELRPRDSSLWTARDLMSKEAVGRWVRAAGAVICRQRPGTARGTVFISLEDETGITNAVVKPEMFERCRLIITQEPYLIIEGRLQGRHGSHIISAAKIEPFRVANAPVATSHDFH